MRDRVYLVCNYIDDLLGAELWDRVWDSFSLLGRILRDIGVKESAEKLKKPTQCINCLGMQVDSKNMTISILPHRLQEIRKEAKLLATQQEISKKQPQKSWESSVLFVIV